MKQKLIFAATLITTTLGVIIPPSSASVPISNNFCSVDQRAEVYWEGNWYQATVLDVEDNSCFISYEGSDSSWDEWVQAERFRIPFGTGDSVRVLWKGEWYPARILNVSDSNYYIHYEGYDSSWDEWVEPARISR